MVARDGAQPNVPSTLTVGYGARTNSKWDLAKEEIVVLSPLPCWKHLASHQVRARVAERIRLIEEETAAEHRRRGTRPLGVPAILRKDPHYQPEKMAQSPAPKVSRGFQEGLLGALRGHVRVSRRLLHSERPHQAGTRGEIPRRLLPLAAAVCPVVES